MISVIFTYWTSIPSKADRLITGPLPDWVSSAVIAWVTVGASATDLTVNVAVAVEVL